MPDIKRLFILFACWMCFFQSFGQKTTFSPRSRYGIGEWNRISSPQNWTLNGAGAALNDPSYVNIQNPASYGWFDLTVFETGLTGTSNLQQTAYGSIWKNTIHLSHVSFGIPITRWWGLAFGLTPHTGTGYNITDEEYHTGIGKVTLKYEGTGGTNTVFLGNGFRIKKRLGIGANISYLFGDIVNDRRAIYSSLYSFNTRVREDFEINDYLIDLGIQYKAQVGEKNALTFGATYSPARSVNARRYLLAFSYETISSVDVLKDTILSIENEAGKINLPSDMTAGVSYTTDKWLVSLQGRSRPWSELTKFGTSDSLYDETEISVGFQYIPDRFSVNSLLRSTRYRAGLRYSTGHYPAADGPLPEYGISFGLGIPLKKSLSTINTGFEISSRGNKDPGNLKETFFRLNFGISINDKWFIKRKYN